MKLVLLCTKCMLNQAIGNIKAKVDIKLILLVLNYANIKADLC
jgi:hypothetical protein